MEEAVFRYGVKLQCNQTVATADKGLSPSLGVGCGADTPCRKEAACYELLQRTSDLMVGKHRDMRPLRKPCRRWENIIKLGP
jgi:hypothetical protein